VDTGARDRGGRGFGSWFKPRKTGSFPRGTETSRKAFFLVKKKQIVYGISVCVSLHFSSQSRTEKVSRRANHPRETETSHTPRERHRRSFRSFSSSAFFAKTHD